MNTIAVRKGKVVYVENDTLIKVFDERDWTKSEILNEALNQARIEETGLNIPKIQKVGTVDGKWALMMDYVEGTSLADLMKNEPEKLDEHLALFVALQMEIHSKKAPLLTTLKDKMTRKISKAELKGTVRYDLQLKLRELGITSVVCHCDFKPENIMITADGTPYIIDWSHTNQGNPSVDAAITYILFKLDGKDDIAEKYLDLYCEKTGVDKKLVLKWVPVAAASKSTTASSAEDKARLLEMAKSVEYLNY
ncbi:MAG: protein kinase family protein [Clostridia bacterium]|nr:protein kinase family protein [Clostridia bacterium]